MYVTQCARYLLELAPWSYTLHACWTWGTSKKYAQVFGSELSGWGSE